MMTPDERIKFWESIPVSPKVIIAQPGDEKEVRNGEFQLLRVGRARAMGSLAVRGWWRLDEPIADLAEYTQRQKALIAAVGSDGAVHDAPRVMRLPGYTNTNPDRNGAVAAIIECHGHRVYPLDALPTPKPTAATAPLGATPPARVARPLSAGSAAVGHCAGRA